MSFTITHFHLRCVCIYEIKVRRNRFYVALILSNLLPHSLLFMHDLNLCISFFGCCLNLFYIINTYFFILFSIVIEAKMNKYNLGALRLQEVKLCHCRYCWSYLQYQLWLEAGVCQNKLYCWSNIKKFASDKRCLDVVASHHSTNEELRIARDVHLEINTQALGDKIDI